MAILAGLLIAPQLLGSALGAQQLEIGTTDYSTTTFGGDQAPASDDYAFSFLNPPFSQNETGNGSIVAFGLEVSLDFGTLTSNDPDRVAYVTFDVSNATTSLEFRYESHAARHLFGFFTLDQDLLINGSKVWTTSTTEIHPWAGLQYQTSMILVFDQNASAFTPIPTSTDTQAAVQKQTYPGGSLLYVDPNDGKDYFSGKHSLRRFYLANLTGPLGVTVSTEYPNGLPKSLSLNYRFEDADAEAQRAAGQDCGGGFSNWVRDLIGACPSIAGILNLVSAGFGAILKLVLGSVFGDPGAGLADFLSTMVQQIMDAIILTTRILLVNPAQAIVVWEVIVLGFALMAGGYMADPALFLRLARAGTWGLLLVVGYWFVFLFIVFRFALTLLVRIFHTLVQAIRG